MPVSASVAKQMSKVIKQNAASLSCQIHSSATCTGKAHSPTVAGKQRQMHSCIGSLQSADICPIKRAPLWGNLDPHLTYVFLGRDNSATPTASRLVQPLLHSSPVCPKHTQTDTLIHRPHYLKQLDTSMHWMQPKNISIRTLGTLTYYPKLQT